MKAIKDLLSTAITRFKAREPAHHFDVSRLPEAGPAWGVLPAEVHEDADRVTVRLEVPGMDPKDFDVRVVGRRLIVSGEKRSETRSHAGHFRTLECAYGSFERTLELPADVLADKVKASYRKGVLHIDLPKAQQVPPRRLEVKVH